MTHGSRIDWPALNTMTLLDAALTYARDGFRVHPLNPDKTPKTWWPGEATTDPATIQRWWAQWPDANIGLAMGAGVHCLDIDTKNGQDGVASYLAAGGTPTWLVEQPTQATPSGGLHLLFRSPESFKNFARQGPHGGLDMRSDGGYIVAAPSRTPDGDYMWAGGDISAPLPDALLASVRALGDRSQPRTTGHLIPEPAEFEPWEIENWIDGLGTEHAGFLRTGGSRSGDTSKQAFLTCLAAFKAGWTREDMAAIGPHTTLYTFGANPPHGASNPWAWCWKYHIEDAWEAAQKELARLDATRMFKVIESEYRGEGSATPARGEAPDIAPGEGEWPPRAWGIQKNSPQSGLGFEGRENKQYAVTTPRVETYHTLLEASRSLPKEDLDAVQRYLAKVAIADLGPGEAEALLGSAKAFSLYPFTVLRPIYNSIKQERLRKTASGAKGEPTEVYVRDQGKFYDAHSKKLIGEQAFKNLKAREFGGDIQQGLDHYLLDTEAVCKGVECLTYDPGLPVGACRDDNGVAVFNTYTPSPLTPSSGDPGEWLRLVDALAFEGGQAETDAFLDRAAFVVQHPGSKFNHGVLIGGAQGVGKDSVLEPLLRAVGRHNINHIHGGALASEFTSWQAGAKLVVLNELDFGSRRDKRQVNEILKPALASPPHTLTINEKNLRPYVIPNRLQCFGFTNHRGALHLERDDRRWLALWATLQIPADHGHPLKAQWDAFFDRYWHWLDAGGDAAVYRFLLDRDISRFNPKARPRVTDWLTEMRENSVDSLEALIHRRILERDGCLRLQVVDAETIVADVMTVARMKLTDNTVISERTVAMALASLGVSRRKVWARHKHGQRGRTYYFPHGRCEVSQWHIDELHRFRKNNGAALGFTEAFDSPPVLVESKTDNVVPL